MTQNLRHRDLVTAQACRGRDEPKAFIVKFCAAATVTISHRLQVSTSSYPGRSPPYPHKSSILPKLTGAKRESCTAGHKIEKPLVERLVAHSESSNVDTRLKVQAVCQPGLVGKAEKLYAKDLIDFLAYATPTTAEGEPEPTESLVGIEVKTRVTPHTAQDEFDRSTAPSGDHQVYEIVDAGDDSFTRRFRDQHEAVQVLHHAYCYDLEHVLLLAGDRGANIISGTWVRFNSDMKEMYGSILDTVYELCLKWAYDESMAFPDELDEVQPGTWVRFNSDIMEMCGSILDTVYELCLKWAYDESMAIPDELDEVLAAAASKTQVTREEFEMNLGVWRETMKLKLPIPRIARVIPRVFAEWNVKKGGSDTVTQLIDSVYLGPPILRSQTVLVARYFMIYGVGLHQLQKVGSSDDVEVYVTVEAYRNAATQRVGNMRKTLIKISKCLFELASESSSVPGSSIPETPAAASVSESHPFTRSQASAASRLKPMEVSEPVTGKTPKRKRQQFYDKDAAELNTGNKFDNDGGGVPRDGGLLCARECCEAGLEWKRGMGRQACVVCQNKTSNFCLTCRMPLCTTNISGAADRLGEPPFVEANMESLDGGEPSKLYFRNSCSDIWHHEGRQKYRRPGSLENVTTNLESMFQVE
eukprot:CAMPEP_0194065850 /NCGR_PEP_ID=MMETSP0009_2-20130614/85696_1 /TAXON_ID=210454 /ORGANISM="Grammatophora oceanica, Strain CCMP 410" /LENGTH=642 /DNA_ID=CAMNT_0038718741 /DNA_START=1379 /DNA_END=3307 /DNA_ORIENTATION=+